MFNLPKRLGALEVLKPTDAAARAPAVGASWAWGAYNQLEASSARPYVLVGLNFAFGAAASGLTSINADQQVQAQVAIGAAGAEVVIAEVMVNANVNYVGVLGGQVIISYGGFLPVEPVVIPTGSRLAIRAAGGFTVAPAFAVYTVGYEPSLAGFAPLTWKLQRLTRALRAMTPGTPGTWRTRAIPTAAAGVTVTPTGLTFGFGPSVDIINGTSGNPVAGAFVVLGLVPSFVGVASHYQVEIGLGAAASGPAPAAAVGLPGRSSSINTPAPGLYMLPRPLSCNPGEAVSVRIKGNSATGIPCWLVIAEVP